MAAGINGSAHVVHNDMLTHQNEIGAGVNHVAFMFNHACVQAM